MQHKFWLYFVLENVNNHQELFVVMSKALLFTDQLSCFFFNCGHQHLFRRSISKRLGEGVGAKFTCMREAGIVKWAKYRQSKRVSR